MTEKVQSYLKLRESAGTDWHIPPNCVFNTVIRLIDGHPKASGSTSHCNIIFSLTQIPQACSCAHLAPYSMDTGAPFILVQTAGVSVGTHNVK
jgi:hypothetical protein